MPQNQHVLSEALKCVLRMKTNPNFRLFQACPFSNFRFLPQFSIFGSSSSFWPQLVSGFWLHLVSGPSWFLVSSSTWFQLLFRVPILISGSTWFLVSGPDSGFPVPVLVSVSSFDILPQFWFPAPVFVSGSSSGFWSCLKMSKYAVVARA